MQIKHEVGVMRQQQQRAAQALQFGRRRPSLQVVTHGTPHQAHIGQGVVPQLIAHHGFHRCREVRIVTVEVFRGVELKTAHRFVVQPLRQADRVGHRHQHNFAGDVPGSLSGFKQCAQMVRHQHAGQFLGVQAGLDINLAATAGAAKVKTAQGLVAAKAGREQRVVNAFHGSMYLCQSLRGDR